MIVKAANHGCLKKKNVIELIEISGVTEANWNKELVN